MWFDGASNILGNGIGVVLNSPKDQSCIMGLLMALEHQAKRLKVYRDSTLVIYQLREEWGT
ncbi:hypothetical protein CR513_02578, partial [Mucuna pruriens]